MLTNRVGGSQVLKNVVGLAVAVLGMVLYGHLRNVESRNRLGPGGERDVLDPVLEHVGALFGGGRDHKGRRLVPSSDLDAGAPMSEMAPSATPAGLSTRSPVGASDSS